MKRALMPSDWEEKLIAAGCPEYDEKAHEGKLGCSAVPSVFAVGYTSRLELVRQFLDGKKPTFDDYSRKACEHGRALETPALVWYGRSMQTTVKHMPTSFHPHMALVGTPDGMDGEGNYLEVKWRYKHDLMDIDNPSRRRYFLQMYANMAIVEARREPLPAYKLLEFTYCCGGYARVTHCPRDRDVQDEIEKVVGEFLDDPRGFKLPFGRKRSFIAKLDKLISSCESKLYSILTL